MQTAAIRESRCHPPGLTQAADFKLQILIRKPGHHVDDAVLHAPGFEGVDDVEDLEAH
jgi:hypothetical protein